MCIFGWHLFIPLVPIPVGYSCYYGCAFLGLVPVTVTRLWHLHTLRLYSFPFSWLFLGYALYIFHLDLDLVVGFPTPISPLVPLVTFYSWTVYWIVVVQLLFIVIWIHCPRTPLDPSYLVIDPTFNILWIVPPLTPSFIPVDYLTLWLPYYPSYAVLVAGCCIWIVLCSLLHCVTFGSKKKIWLTHATFDGSIPFSFLPLRAGENTYALAVQFFIGFSWIGLFTYPHYTVIYWIIGLSSWLLLLWIIYMWWFCGHCFTDY